MPKVLISDKLSESAIEVFKENKVETSYMPGIEKEQLSKIRRMLERTKQQLQHLKLSTSFHNLKQI